MALILNLTKTADHAVRYASTISKLSTLRRTAPVQMHAAVEQALIARLQDDALRDERERKGWGVLHPLDI
jgi:hypothetical protein